MTSSAHNVYPFIRLDKRPDDERAEDEVIIQIINRLADLTVFYREKRVWNAPKIRESVPLMTVDDMAMKRIMRWNDWTNSWITHKFNLKIDNSNIASDAVLLVPGSDLSFKIMMPLIGDKVACAICENREVRLFFMTLSDMDKHLSLHRVDARI